MEYEFATAGRIIFGPGRSLELGHLTAEQGRRAFFLTGSNPERADSLLQLLAGAGLEPVPHSISGEPTIDQIQLACEIGRSEGCDVVVAVGGGSVLDAGKAVAALLTNGGEPLDYLEVIGEGRPLEEDPVPCIAVPTTAGTGSEVTKNAVLTSTEHGVKVSMRDPSMIPDIALIDPLLTHSMSPALTASTGLDALAQVLEPFVSSKANPLTDALCREGLARAIDALPHAYRNGEGAKARESMAVASLCGGLALANAGLGAVHGFAGPMGGMLGIPHGVICGRLLPGVVAANAKAVKERMPDSRARQRFDELGTILTGKRSAKAAGAVAKLEELCAELSVPALGTYGLTEEHFEPLIAKARNASSMKGNPVALTDEELAEVLRTSL